MFRCYLLALLVVPLCVFGQSETKVGLNLPSLVMGTVDLQGEMKLAPSFWLQMGAGFRTQSRNGIDPSSVRFLESYSQLKNKGAFFMIGGRLVNPHEDEYEYPYIGFHLVGTHYKESLFPNDTGGGQAPVEVNGLRLGFSTTIGFALRINPRLYADLAIQMGYAKPREDVLAYYLPGMGYSTFGYGFVGVKGGHAQPVITLKYTIVRDKRDRIRSKD